MDDYVARMMRLGGLTDAQLADMESSHGLEQSSHHKTVIIDYNPDGWGEPESDEHTMPGGREL
jgi:hypothetical protein